MKIENRKVASFAIFGLLGVALIGAPVKVAAQSPVSNAAPVKKTGSVVSAPSPASNAAPEKKSGYVEDWTSHRLVFSNPGEESQAMQNPLDYARWLQIQSDPRYLMQQVRRIGRQPKLSLLNSEGSLENSVNIHLPNSPSLQLIKGLSNPEISSFPAARRKVKTTIATDWSMGLDGSQATANVTVAGTLTNSNITSATTLTIAGTQFNASAPTAASQTGNFSAFPTSSGGNSIAVKVGSNTLTLSTNATAASSTATFTAPVLGTTSVAFTSGGNTLTMTPAGAGAQYTGTWNATPTSTSVPTVTITSSPNSAYTFTTNATSEQDTMTVSAGPSRTTPPSLVLNNIAPAATIALTLTTAATAGTEAATFATGAGYLDSGSSNVVIKNNLTNSISTNSLTLTMSGSAGSITIGTPTSNDIITINSRVYEFETSTRSAFCSGADNCVQIGASPTATATNLVAAMAGTTCFNSGGCPSPSADPSVLTSQSAGVVNLINMTGATISPFTSSSGTHEALSPATFTQTTTNGCSSSTVGSFIISNSATTLGSNLAAAITACNSSNPSNVLATAGSATGLVTVTATILGPYVGLTASGTAGGHLGSWTSGGGATGSNSCSGSTTLTGHFAVGSAASTATNDIASNINTAIGDCSGATTPLGITASVTGSVVTVTNPTPGPFITTSGSTAAYTWALVGVTGSAGSNTCNTGTKTGTFAVYGAGNGSSATGLTTLASNLAAAINACGGGGANLGATSNTPVSSTLIITDAYPGVAVNTFTATPTSGPFAWGSTESSAGSNGGAGCTGSAGAFTGTFVNSNSSNTLAGNFNSAIILNSCPTNVGFTSTPGTNTVLIADSYLGQNTFTPSTGVAWSATSAGSNGTTSCTGTAPTFTANYVLGATTSNLASNLSSEIATCNNVTMGITSTSSTTQVTVTASTAGTGGNTGSSLTSNSAGYFAWTASSLAGGADGVTDGTATPPTFAYWSVNDYISGPTLATNVAAAIAANANMQAIGGVTAVAGTSGSNGTIAFVSRNTATFTLTTSTTTPFTNLTRTGGTASTGLVQPNAYPALFGDGATASCSDYIVYPTGRAGSSTAPSIIAYTNLYESCSSNGPVPSVYWAYNPTNGYSVTTSPVISDDGTAVAFVESDGSGANLVVIAMQATSSGSVSSATTPAAAPGNDITSCSSLPCMAITSLSNDDTYSSPFYIYSYDTFVVGDDVGDLEVSKGAFGGAAPASATFVNLGHAVPLASPVFDQTSGCIFVGDTTGYLYSVNSGISGSVCTGAGITVNATSSLLGATGAGIFDAPIVDSTNQNVYAFVTGSAAFSGSSCTTAGWNCIYQFGTGFASATHGTTNAHVGTGAAGYNLYAGDFDNVFYANPTPAGHLWAMGNSGSPGGNLYRVVVGSGGALGAVTTVITGLTDTSTSHFAFSSPVTEFCSGTCTTNGTITTGSDSVDYIFFSVDRLTTAVGTCGTTQTNGCILAYTITTPTSPSNSGALGVTTTGSPGCYSTGGLVIDNSDTTTQGASNVYFVGLNGESAGGPNGKAASGCTTVTPTTSVLATQAAQSGL